MLGDFTDHSPIPRMLNGFIGYAQEFDAYGGIDAIASRAIIPAF